MNRCHLASQILGHCSTLRWPSQQCPPQCHWKIWSRALAGLHSNKRLHTRLGTWTIHKLHQEWAWFLDPTTSVLYSCSDPNLIQKFSPVVRMMRPRTRLSSTPQYRLQTTTSVARLPAELLPCTIQEDEYTGLTSAIAGPAIPAVPLVTESLNLMASLHNSPFYSLLLPDLPPNIDTICDAIQDHVPSSLTILTTNAYEPGNAQARHGWTVLSLGKVLWSAVFTVNVAPDSHSTNRSCYFSLLGPLHVLLCICPVSPPTKGMVTIFHDNNTLLNCLRKNRYCSIKSALTTDADLLYELQYLTGKLGNELSLQFKSQSTDAGNADSIEQQHYNLLIHRINQELVPCPTNSAPAQYIPPPIVQLQYPCPEGPFLLMQSRSSTTISIPNRYKSLFASASAGPLPTFTQLTGKPMNPFG
jgi:hypothetical protein